MRKLALLAALVAVTPWLSAQRAVVAPRFFTPAHPTAHSVPPRTSLVSLHDHAAFQRSRGVFYPFGDWSSFYPGDYSPNDYPAGAQPSVIMVPVGSGSMMGNQNQEEAPRPPADPLIIELQGDRYVRVTESGNTESASAKSHPLLTTVDDVSSHESRSAKSPSPRTPSQPTDLAPVALIFRDGHSEEVRDYTIADGIIYARGNLYSDGYWNKKIEIAKLNIPQTVTSNQSRGITFLLPSAPNEVITRP